MSGKRKRTKGKAGFNSDNFWQSASYNSRTYTKNFNWICSLAVNRFVWDGLPDTCNARILEYILLKDGCATVAPDANGVWFSLPMGATYDYNVYMEPSRWQVFALNGSKLYDSDADSGVVVWENMQKYTPWSTIELLARELTQIERTLQVNRGQQRSMVVFNAPREYRQVLMNVAKQWGGYEPAVISDESLMEHMKTDMLKLDVPFLADELWADRQNAWNEVYRFLGIQHLAFEKNERMIEQEAEANSEPAGLMAMNELQTRREAADRLSELLGSEVSVSWNTDADTYAFPNAASESEVTEDAEQRLPDA